MTPLWFSLYLSYLCLGTKAPAQTTHLKSSNHFFKKNGFLSANVGDSVTIQCFYEREGDMVMFYWFKQTLGTEPRLISTFYKYKEKSNLHNEFQHDTRVAVEAGNGINHLTISDLRTSDSASYYCAGSDMLTLKFFEGTTIIVRGSGMNIEASVHQSASQTIQPGDSLTLNCTVHIGTCGGEHSVYWFKDSGESHPGLIYTQGEGNDQCERNSDTQTHTCVYNLPMESLNFSLTGIYYCAVASCGQMLFGNGTKVDYLEPAESFALVYFLICALAFTITLTVLLAYAAYAIHKRNSCQCKELRPAVLASNADENQDPNNVQYAALRAHQKNRSRRQVDETLSVCVYSSVKH